MQILEFSRTLHQVGCFYKKDGGGGELKLQALIIKFLLCILNKILGSFE